MIVVVNAIVGKLYCYGGGYGDFEDLVYDCLGLEFYAFHGGGFIDMLMDLIDFMSFGEVGEGMWITSYVNFGYLFFVVVGLCFDMGFNNSLSSGFKWSL